MNKNLQGGYYIVSLGGVELLGESVSLPNIAKLLYEAKKHKFVVLQDIVIGGNMKVAISVSFDASMAYTTEPDDWDEETDGEFIPEPIYTANIYNVYGKNIAIDAEGVATITDYISDGLDPEGIPTGDILKDGVLGFDEDGDLVKGDLIGKYVEIVASPTSTTLTEEEVSKLTEGVFTKGSLPAQYGTYDNLVFFPKGATNSGVAISGKVPGEGDLGAILRYTIDSDNKLTLGRIIRFFDDDTQLAGNITFYSGNGHVDLRWGNENYRISKPTLPGSSFLIATGDSSHRHFEWTEYKKLYLHTITFNVSGGRTFVIRIVSDSDTACALDSVSGNFVIAGATCLIPSNMGNAVLTPFDANGFNPDIHLFDSATGAYSTAVTLASVESDTITPIG